MTTTYDPRHPRYLDEADLRSELGRVYDLCQGCRLCFNLCPSFPTLFGFVDGRDGDVAAMTATEQDRVVDECYQCKLCALKCPYVPPHEWELDFPRLMMRAVAVRTAGSRSLRQRVSEQAFGRTDLVGAVSSAAAPVVNALTGRPGSLPRRVLERTGGVASERLLPPYARTRFSTWFRHRAGGGTRASDPEPAQGAVSVFPTCFVEYMDPSIGQDLVKVFERNRVTCSLPQVTRCCGAPWLHQGNIREFTRAAIRNVAVLADEVRAGREVVVSQPTCAYVVRRDYPIYLAGSPSASDADLVAAHTVDPAEYLVALDRAEGTSLDTRFPGREEGLVPERVTYHVACHQQAQQTGLKGRDLLKRAGIAVTLVQRCSGIDGTWGYRAENYERSRAVARPLVREVQAAGHAVVCGDCHLANGAIEQETGSRPLHPIQLVARAYGIAEEPS